MTDQTLLAHIALTDTDWGFRWVAVANLTDQELLWRIAETDPRVEVRRKAGETLTDRNLLASLAGHPYLEDGRKARLFVDGKNTPEEPDHLDWIAEVRFFLTAPVTVEEIGETKLKFTVNDDLSQTYTAFGNDYGVKGETVSIEVQGKNLPSSVSAEWKTEFPEGFVGNAPGFVEATPDLGGLAAKLLERFSQAGLAKFAEVGGYGASGLKASGHRKSPLDLSIELLDDQGLLKTVALSSKYTDAKDGALEKVTDQGWLTVYALANEPHVGSAIKNISDEKLLGRLALKLTDTFARQIVISKLRDETLLTKIALSDSDIGARDAARRRLQEINAGG